MTPVDQRKEHPSVSEKSPFAFNLLTYLSFRAEMNTQNITPLVGPVCLANVVQTVPGRCQGGRGCKLLRHLLEVVGRQQAGPLV